MAYGRYSRPSNSGGYQKKNTELPPFKKPTFAPSTYQMAVLDALKNTADSIIIDAKAGSGKTSTISLIVAELLDMIPLPSYVVVAFNKSISLELQARGMNGRTFHSLGYSTVSFALSAKNGGVRPELDAQKVAGIIRETYQDADGFSGALTRLVSLAKNHMLTPACTNDEIIRLISHFDVDWDDENIHDQDMCDMVRAILAANNANTRTIDFDDQLYFVSLLNLKLTKFDYILVDESQDTNPLRRDLIRRMMHSSSRVIAVGDPQQAIYGFTGASHDSMDLIRESFNATVLPLSVSYRCPRRVIELAQTIVPDILARDDAPDGSILRLETMKRSAFQPTDLVICRNTAPLVETAYKLLAARIPCRIMGREIGASLTSLIKRLTRKNETLESLTGRLITYRDVEATKAMDQRKETKAQAIRDKVDAILSILESMTPEDSDGGIPRLIAIIDGMFADKTNGCTTLATVHKAKGLEASRVIILDSHLMPSKMARQDWQIQQERNLMYVAYTRSLDTLVFIDTKNLID